MTDLPDKLHLKTITAKGSSIIVVARDEHGERWTINVNGFRPYWFVSRADEAVLRKRGMEYQETDIIGLDDEPLFQVFVDTPEQVSKRRKGFTKTYEADVPYVRRFLIDTGIKDGFYIEEGMVMGSTILCEWTHVKAIQYRNPDRQLLYDIETNKPYGSDKWSPAVFADGPVSALTFQDSMEEAFHSYLWHPARGTKGQPRTEMRSRYSRGFGREVAWYVHWHGSEREMFEGILSELKERRPDTMSAWNGHYGSKRIKNQGGFDIPYLVNRTPKLGLSPSNWSPVGNAYAGYYNFGKSAAKGKWRCGVDGVQLIDSMTTETVKSGGMMPATQFIALKTHVREKTKDDPEGPIELDKGVRNNIDWFWEHDVEKFLSYAFDDVDAQLVVERKDEHTNWIREIQQFVGAEDANRLFTPMSLVNTMTHRLARAQGTAVPTAGQEDNEEGADDESTGGHVEEPKQKGVQKAMAILDLDAMYVNIIRSGNLSWETWVGNPTEAEKEHLICVPDTDFGPQYFLQPDVKVGLSAQTSAYFKQAREGYDRQIALETDADKIKALKKARDPAKQLTLAVWGNTLSEFFPLFRKEVGASILGMGRYIIRGVDKLLQEHGYFIQYGDTDSAFVPLRSPFDPDHATEAEKEAIIKEGMDLCALINAWFDDMAKECNMHTHTFNIGFETLLAPYAQGTQKKQYAGRVVWQEGSWQSGFKTLIKGVPGIKSDAAPITKRVTQNVVHMMLTGTDPTDILQYVWDVYETALDGDVDLADIVRGQALSEVPSLDADPNGLHYIQKAAWRGMRDYLFEYQAGGRVTLLKLKGNDKLTLAIPEGEDIPEDVPVDWAQHIDATILDPIKGVMDWIDMLDQLEAIRVGSTPIRTNALP